MLQKGRRSSGLTIGREAEGKCLSGRRSAARSLARKRFAKQPRREGKRPRGHLLEDVFLARRLLRKYREEDL